MTENIITDDVPCSLTFFILYCDMKTLENHSG